MSRKSLQFRHCENGRSYEAALFLDGGCSLEGIGGVWAAAIDLWHHDFTDETFWYFHNIAIVGSILSSLYNRKFYSPKKPSGECLSLSDRSLAEFAAAAEVKIRQDQQDCLDFFSLPGRKEETFTLAQVRLRRTSTPEAHRGGEKR